MEASNGCIPFFVSTTSDARRWCGLGAKGDEALVRQIVADALDVLAMGSLERHARGFGLQDHGLDHKM
jgi:hypothetical protein